MKKILLILLLFTPMLWAEEIKVDVPQPSITKYVMTDFLVDVDDSYAIVMYASGYMDGGEFVKVSVVRVEFQGTDFNQLFQAINSGNNIKQTINNACKTKLGL